MSHRTSQDILIGVAVGGLLGTLSALMIAPRSGKNLRKGISEVCCGISNRTQNAVDSMTKQGSCFAKKIGLKSPDLSDKAKEFFDGISKWMNLKKEEECHSRDLIIGSIVGITLGAVAGLLLAPKSGIELREEIIDNYNNISEKTSEMTEKLTKNSKAAMEQLKSKTNGWLSILQDVVEQISDKVEESKEDAIEKGQELFNKSKLKNAMDWALLGLRVMERIKKKG
jgi:gas vesicle protein